MWPGQWRGVKGGWAVMGCAVGRPFVAWDAPERLFVAAGWFKGGMTNGGAILRQQELDWKLKGRSQCMTPPVQVGGGLRMALKPWGWLAVVITWSLERWSSHRHCRGG